MSSRTALRSLALAFVVTVAACGSGSSGGGQGDIVARADDHEFTVTEAATLLNGQSNIPKTPQVVRALANLWIDYVLLAEEDRSDSTFQKLDVSSVVQPQLEQDRVLALRDSAVHPDTTFTDAELRQAFEKQGSQEQVHARHILLTYPKDASQAQKDSVRQLALDLRKRALAGEDFGTLAKKYSKDPGSASRGGDLGFFKRGQMVPAFEKAAFALDSGQISQPVETRFGIHIIKSEGKKKPTFEDNREAVARQLRQRRTYVAESTYVAGITDTAGIEVAKDAAPLVRDIATDPGTELTGRARKRALVHYHGGEVTAGELQAFLRGRTAQELGQYKQVSDKQAEIVLNNLARRKLLLAAARNAGVTLPKGRADSLRLEVRRRLRAAVSRVGLDKVQPKDGETEAQAMDRTVHDILVQTLAGRTQVLPLGSLSYTLRTHHDAEVFPAGITRVMDRIGKNAPDSGGSGSGGSTAAPPAGGAVGASSDSAS